MSTADARTVLLARPGEARERLRAALEQAGVDVVLQADPLQADPSEVAASGARNLVIAVDAEVEDALERFDDLLVDPRYRILFEEVGVVTARDGWDAARWSRHLGAKLLGHGDVLPSGHEEDEDVLPVTAIEPVEGIHAPASGPVAAAADDVSALVAESFAPAGMDLATPGSAADAWQSPSQAPVTDAGLAEGEDSEVEPAIDSQLADEAASAPGEALGREDVTAAAGLPADLSDDRHDQTFTATDDVPAQMTAQAGPSAGLPDWAHFQDFDAVDELPAANTPHAAEADYRAALAPLDDDGVGHEQAYQQMQDESARFYGAAPTDRWQDFERPGSDDQAAAVLATDAPQAPSGWALSDESISAAPVVEAAQHDLSHLEARIAGLSLVDDDSTEGAVVLVGGIGGPDPLRQILQQLQPGLSAPVLVQQWLDGGQYDRLVRQMGRATSLPVELAIPGQAAKPAHVYIVPVAVGIERDGSGALRFTDGKGSGFVDLLSGLPAAASGVFMLSGAGEEFVEPALRFQQAGGRLYAQAAEGCYDHAVPGLLIGRGAEAQLPPGLATQLAARWQQQVSE